MCVDVVRSVRAENPNHVAVFCLASKGPQFVIEVICTNVHGTLDKRREC